MLSSTSRHYILFKYEEDTNMNKDYCAAKEKWVNISNSSINASVTSDYQKQFIPGRIECSDRDYLCESLECPIQKILSEIKGS